MSDDEHAVPVFRRLSKEPDRSYSRARRWVASGGLCVDSLDHRPRMTLEDFATAEGITVGQIRTVAARWTWRQRASDLDAMREQYAEARRMSSARWIALIDSSLKQLIALDASELKPSELVQVTKLAVEELARARQREGEKPVVLAGVTAEDIERAKLTPGERALFTEVLRRIRDAQATG